MRLPVKIGSLLLVMALAAPQFAHADTMGWDITLFKYVTGGPPDPLPSDPPAITVTETFFISIWDTPVVSGFIDPDDDNVLTYFGDVKLFPDGVSYPHDPVIVLDTDFFPGTILWTGDPHHPDFVVGEHEAEGDHFGDYTDVVAVEAPEPSTIELLGTGVLGLVGLFRRRLQIRKEQVLTVRA